MKHVIYIVLLLTIAGCASIADNLHTDNLNTDNLNTDNLHTGNLNTDNLNTDNSTAKQNDPTPTAAIAANTNAKPKEQLICKTEKKLGSNHKTRICRLKDHEHDTAIRNRQMMEDLGAK